MAQASYLIRLKDELRSMSKQDRHLFSAPPDEIAAGYHFLLANAPSRQQGYLSAKRSGITSSGDASNREEEHLAIALYAKKRLLLPDGGWLQLLDYQFPLKSVMSDSGIGKVDLLGLFDDGTLAIVELKVRSSLEDPRIGILEGLIYAAIVEANRSKIADEIQSAHGRAVIHARPRVLLVAEPEYWSNHANFPLLQDVRRQARDITAAIPNEIYMLRLQNAGLLEFGLNGNPPSLSGAPFLKHMSDSI